MIRTNLMSDMLINTYNAKLQMLRAVLFPMTFTSVSVDSECPKEKGRTPGVLP